MVAKLTASAQFHPWEKPPWKASGNVTTNSPGRCKVRTIGTLRAGEAPCPFLPRPTSGPSGGAAVAASPVVHEDTRRYGRGHAVEEVGLHLEHQRQVLLEGRLELAAGRVGRAVPRLRGALVHVVNRVQEVVLRDPGESPMVGGQARNTSEALNKAAWARACADPAGLASVCQQKVLKRAP